MAVSRCIVDDQHRSPVFAARDYGQRAADRSYDHLLVSSALSILGGVSLVGGQWQVDLPYVALDVLGMAPEDRVFIVFTMRTVIR